MDVAQSFAVAASAAAQAAGVDLRVAYGAPRTLPPASNIPAQLDYPRQKTPESTKPTVSQEAAREAAAKLNKFMLGAGTDLRFKLDSELGRIIVSVVSADTGEVVQQIPSEELVRLARMAAENSEFSGGGLVDESA